MADENKPNISDDDVVDQNTDRFVPTVVEHSDQLSGMFRNWYLEYASYVILERAVPHIEDGLKPVQRRILHSMFRLDDGRYMKVANIVGNTMQYHPHGDASIGDALVQLGQKELLIDTQGNWGNILTGDSAAAPRYIEARLSEFALETMFNPKITEWIPSYDGRDKEPVTLPAKFPLLLAQGAEGIAVGLSSKILPHNFNEILDAAVACLREEPFTLYPDFATGGYLDVSRYNDGERGGSVKVRAKIEKIDNKTLAITELPFSKNTSTLISSILAAMDKGKIKIRKVEDNTSATAKIIVHLIPGTSSDMAIDALYAFTDCEVSISPNCCVIKDRKPHFLTVSELLRHSVNLTMGTLRRELEIELNETLEAQLFASLEKIFIENRLYKDVQLEEATDIEQVVVHLDKRLTPWKKGFYREITREDILRLMEIRMKRIPRFSSEEAEEKIIALDKKIESIKHNLNNIVDYTISWYTRLKDKYGAAFPRRTVIRGFDSIEATRVADANRRLYIDREEGFIGTSLKDAEFICNCSDIDDIIIFYKDGTYKVVKVQEKMSVGNGKNIIYVNIFKRGDTRMTYNVVYLNGKGGAYYMKRFHITGITRDKQYNLTKGLDGSKVLWFSANPNGEAETLRITLKPRPRLKVLQFDLDFSNLKPKGKESLGNLVTKNEIHRITLKEKGASTLGGRKVWFDRDVLRINYDGRGEYLGEFNAHDLVLVIMTDGTFQTTTFSDTNHYEDNILKIEKFDADKIWTVVLNDASQGFPYIKRFRFEASPKPQRFLGDDPSSTLILMTDVAYPRINVTFKGADSIRPALEIDGDEFIGVKSFKAKGKRISNFNISEITELEPVRFPEETHEGTSPDNFSISDEEISQTDVRDELTGQQQLFKDELEEEE